MWFIVPNYRSSSLSGSPLPSLLTLSHFMRANANICIAFQEPIIKLSPVSALANGMNANSGGQAQFPLCGNLATLPQIYMVFCLGPADFTPLKVREGVILSSIPLSSTSPISVCAGPVADHKVGGAPRVGGGRQRRRKENYYVTPHLPTSDALMSSPRTLSCKLFPYVLLL